jgi:hypothetical protein
MTLPAGAQVSAEDATIKAIVDQHFPQALVLRAQEDNYRLNRRSCFSVYARRDGIAQTIAAGYVDGALSILERQENGTYTTIALVTPADNPFMVGEGCQIRAVDLDGDGKQEIRLGLSGSAGGTADWFFRWNGVSLTNIGPTDEDGLTELYMTEVLDLDHEGNLEVVGMGEIKQLYSDEVTGFWPEPVRHVYRYSGGMLVKDRTLSYLKSFQRSTQKPETEKVTLDFEQAPTTQFQLRVINGERDGGRRLSSGQIRINGAEVVSSSQLNQQVEFLNIVVSLQQRNTIEVTLAAKPEGTLLLTIEPLSQGPPPNP